jgi:broad specificity phosphatase PhoE
VQIVLVRHGQPQWNREGRSVVDPELTDLGHRQAHRVAEHLTGQRFDQILVSPLLRARQTAQPIGEALSTEPTVLDWMAEIREPAWDGSPVEHVERIFAQQRLREVEALWEGLDEGESFRAFHERVTGGLAAHLADLDVVPATEHPRVFRLRDPDLRLLLVAHGGTNAVAIGSLLGIPPVPWEWERFVSYHCSVTLLETVSIGGGHAFSLHRLSDLSHLPSTLHTA